MDDGHTTVQEAIELLVGTATDTAEELGAAPSAVRMWRTGHRDPRTENKLKLIALLRRRAGLMERCASQLEAEVGDRTSLS